MMTEYTYTNKISGTVHRVIAGASAKMARDALVRAIEPTIAPREGKKIIKITAEHCDDGNWIEAICQPGRGDVATGRAVKVIAHWGAAAGKMADERHDAGSRAAGRYFASGGVKGW